ncbi:Misato Segment II tubulin-like domain-containing protein [Metschnikowia aff. pulcherrima]|uniref:Misato Segment II tubulin-like domain-containing protein n=1 Tax=Metschnikowia aff. pulcherrima TaxID=2163413 RepID=A0A4P6XGD4_9ASCO|nr:Misato Segment II tubulin-like domain-containing protein [Metschnikowia aff. pulcherrima]
MHEVINFSCSQASGHLITQLYNVQESHLPYTRNKTLTHANDVFLVASKVKGRTNYYPRSINVEFQGGFGYLEAILSSNYDSSSLWHRAATQSMFVNSLWGLNCQADNPVSMATIENNLLRGNSSRNVVNEVFIILAQTNKEKETQFGIVGDVNIMDMYLNAGQTLQKPLEVERLSLGLTLGNGKHTYAKGVVGKMQPELGKTDLVTDTYVNRYMDEITKIDTFPDILQTSEFGVEFSQTDSLKYLLKDYRKTVERVRHPQHMEILGDKLEVIESLSSLMQEYTIGYSDESDFDD